MGVSPPSSILRYSTPITFVGGVLKSTSAFIDLQMMMTQNNYIMFCR